MLFNTSFDIFSESNVEFEILTLCSEKVDEIHILESDPR